MDRAYQNKESMPFFAWQCLSITLSHRDVDLVIKDEKEQNNLVKYLIYKLNTIDGRAGSAKPILDILEQEGIENFRKKRKISS